MKNFFKTIRRARKTAVIFLVRRRKRIRILIKELFRSTYQFKIVLASSLTITLFVVFAFAILTNERFPYDLKTLFSSQEFLSISDKPSDSSSYIEMGSGLLSFNRSDDIEYLMHTGQSLPEIAYLYNLEVVELMLYNNISSLEAVDNERSIIIPSARNIIAFMDKVDRGLLNNAIEAYKKSENTKSLLPKTVNIACTKRSDGQSITAVFSVVTEIKDKGVYYEWDLGDGKKSFRKTFNYTYNTPGTYIVNLSVKDIHGNQIRSRPIYLDIPYATNISNSGQLFITVNNVGDTFFTDGEVYSVYDALGRIKEPIQFVNKSEGRWYYQAHASGYYSLQARTPQGTKRIFLFISPFDSVNNDRTDVDWYRTQFNTGLSNCGPAIASMSIGWAKGEYVSVTSIRDMIGWSGNGSTSFFDIKSVLDSYKVSNSLTQIASPDDIYKIIDKGQIVGVVYNCGKISFTRDQPQYDLIGKYYPDAVGHYSIIKGYTKDKRYFIIYDPLPSDWVNNGLRYGDAASMIGRNRYYPTDELFRAMSSGMVLVIYR